MKNFFPKEMMAFLITKLKLEILLNFKFGHFQEWKGVF